MNNAYSQMNNLPRHAGFLRGLHRKRRPRSCVFHKGPVPRGGVFAGWRYSFLNSAAKYRIRPSPKRQKGPPIFGILNRKLAPASKTAACKIGTKFAIINVGQNGARPEK
jgi:hypothetical protein